MRRVVVTVFPKQESQLRACIALLKKGFWAQSNRAISGRWIMDDNHRCELIMQHWLFNRLIDLKIVELRDDRYYLAEDAPEIVYKTMRA